MKQMENVMKAAGVTQNSFVQTAADIRSNIEFMNQIKPGLHICTASAQIVRAECIGRSVMYTQTKRI